VSRSGMGRSYTSSPPYRQHGVYGTTLLYIVKIFSINMELKKVLLIEMFIYVKSFENKMFVHDIHRVN
jgi:hypothetical protein